MSDRHVAALARTQQRLNDELRALRTERLATRKLLRKIRKVLARYRVIQLDALIKQIDDLLGEAE